MLSDVREQSSTIGVERQSLMSKFFVPKNFLRPGACPVCAGTFHVIKLLYQRSKIEVELFTIFVDKTSKRMFHFVLIRAFQI